MSDAFKRAWARKAKEGFQYGEDALEQVRFGFELAQEEAAREQSMTSARDKLKRAVIHHIGWDAREVVDAVDGLIEAKLRERGL